MSATRWTLADNHGVALPLDNNPNTTAPPAERVFSIPALQSGTDSVWLRAEGGTCSVELWMQDEQGLWWLCSAASALAAGVVTPRAALTVPFVAPLFARVTAVAGATRIVAGTLAR